LFISIYCLSGPKGLDGIDGLPGLPGPKGNVGGQGTFFLLRMILNNKHTSLKIFFYEINFIYIK